MIDKNYEDKFEEKQNFLNARCNEFINQTIPKMIERLIKRLSEILDKKIEFKNTIENNMVLKEQVYGTAGENIKSLILGLGTTASGSLATLSALLTIAVAFEIEGSFSVFLWSTSKLGKLTSLLGKKSKEYYKGRFQASYKKSIKNLRRKFFAEFNGYEIKLGEEFDSFKEKTLESAASYLNMRYYPVTIDADKKQIIIENLNKLQKELNEKLSLIIK